jgi:pentatricopeptide repeat protein
MVASGLSVGTITYNALLNACAREGDYVTALEVLDNMDRAVSRAAGEEGKAASGSRRTMIIMGRGMVQRGVGPCVHERQKGPD